MKAYLFIVIDTSAKYGWRMLLIGLDDSMMIRSFLFRLGARRLMKLGFGILCSVSPKVSKGSRQSFA
jgi:hypothetical protein